MIYVAIPSTGQGPLANCIDSLVARTWGPQEFLLWANGGALLVYGRDLEGLDAHSQVYVGGSEKNIGVTPAMQKLYEMGLKMGLQDSDWLLFLHDDVMMKEAGWDNRLEKLVSARPNMGLFGFGGALGLGDPDLYKKPYQLVQLARRDFISNMTAAELHGRRVKEPTRVATLDGFSLGCNMGFLKQIGGFSWWPSTLPHHSYDNALCCMAARHGKEVWMFPLEVDHLGGQTATKVDFQRDFGRPEGEIHSDGHKWLYEEFRDVLPLRVGHAG